MNRYGSRRRKENQLIAVERIHILFRLARERYSVNPELAQRYVDLAKKIGMRYKVRIPTEYRSTICKYCKGYLVPSKTCRTRIQPKREPHVVITCLMCGGHNRIPLRSEAFKGRIERW